VNLSELLSVYAADLSVRTIIRSRLKDWGTFLYMLERGLKLFAKLSLPDLFPSCGASPCSSAGWPAEWSNTDRRLRCSWTPWSGPWGEQSSRWRQ
jgi:hypothetical protein